ncbi:MAG: ABC transporter ATP-binding protein [Pseudomonadota bacterium]
MFGFFERRLDPFPPTGHHAPPETFRAFLWHYAKDAAPWLIAISVMAALLAVGEVMLFAFLGRLVNWLADSDPKTFLADEGRSLFLIGAFILVVMPLMAWLNSLVTHQTLLGNMPMSARWRIHRHLLKQSANFYANEFAGRVATKMMQTSLAVREVMMKVLDILVYVSVYFLAMLALIAAADVRLVAPLVIWLAAYIAIIAYFVPRLRTTSEKQADARSEMTGRIVDSYTNIATVKLFSHAGLEEEYTQDGMNRFLQTVHPQMRLVTQFYGLVYFINCAAVFSVGALSIWLWQGSLISVGAIATAIALTLRIYGMSQWIMWEVSALFENIGVIHDGMSMLTKKIDVEDAKGAKPLNVTKGAIRFDHVKFHYGKEDGVIDDLSLSIAPGEKIGLVGRSGAGKTTITNLLLRFYDLESGSIEIDGQNVAQVTQDSLRSQIGVVTQDTSLLHRSIRENIAYGRPNATDEEIREAIRRANADEFIDALEDKKGRRGLNAHVGERGVKLSGGQRQRIAIARIFLKNAPILILDEATSALDSEVEAAIQDNLFELMRGKTVLAIAHRLSTIAALDRLIVLDQGDIVEMGSHNELVAKGGVYADLWARQSGGFLGLDMSAVGAAE